MAHKFLPHTADVKFQAEGETLEQIFISSADALNETIHGKMKILEQQEKQISVKGKDLENLLYNFLEEFLYLLDAEDFLTARIKEIEINTAKKVEDNLNKSCNKSEEKDTKPLKAEKLSISDNVAESAEGAGGGVEFNLKATLIGDKASNYKFTNDVKAVTYNEMFVKKEKNKYVCQVVLDV